MWTKEEDILLQTLNKKYPNNCKEIAKNIFNRNAIQCF